MKINANEMLLMQNNSGAASRRNSVNKHFESPIPQTNYSMNALEAQGMNNMAFHGAEKAVSPIINKTLNKAKFAIPVGLALFAANCDKYDPDRYVLSDEHVTINTNTTVNNTVIVNNYGSVRDSVNNHYQNNEHLDSMLVRTMEMMELLYNAVITNNQQNADLYQQNIDHMAAIVAMYNAAMAKADDRDAAMDQFMADVREYLEGILQNTNAIKIDLAGFRSDYNFNSNYVKAKLDSLETVGSMSLNELIDISGKIDLMKENQDSISAAGDSLISLVKNFHSDIIAILNGGTSPNVNVTKDDLQAMFNALGITISDAVADSRDELIEAISNGVTAINNNNDQNTAALEARLGNIELKLDDIIARMDTAKVQRDVLIQNSDSAIVLLNKFINNQKDDNAALLAKLDSLGIDVNQFMNNEQLDNAAIIAKLDSMGVDVKQFMINEHADNEGIKAALDSLNGAANNLFNFVSTKSIEINDLDSLFKEYAFDKLAADVDTMKNIGKDFVAPVLTRVNQYIDYVMNIDTTYLDGSQKQMIKAILDKLNNLQVICQCQCNCGNNTGNPNEGVGDPTGDNIGDLFSQNNAKNAKFQEFVPDKTYRIFDTNLFQA